MTTRSNEKFDAMNDAQFAAFWFERMDEVQANATSEAEVAACAAEMRKAEMHRHMEAQGDFH